MKTPAFKTFIGTVAVLGSLVDLSQAAASNVIFPTNYPYTQTNLQTMDVIKSKNGVLEASVIMHSAGTNSAPIKYGLVDAYSGIGSSNVTSTGTNAGMYGFAYQWSAYGTNYPKGFPGTMLQIERGDTLKVRTINNMGETSSSSCAATAQTRPNMARGAATKRCIDYSYHARRAPANHGSAFSLCARQRLI